MAPSSICENLDGIEERINRACRNCGRNPDEVTLIAISKTKPVADILEAADCGQVHFGENKVQELTDKLDQIDRDDLVWHMVGGLQTNKIKYLAGRIDWIHSIPKKKALKEVEKRSRNAGHPVNVLIQVNISGEGQKSGCDPEELAALIEYAGELEYTHIRGLMGIASFADDPEQVRSEFQLLRSLKEKYEGSEAPNIQMDHLSMGMTNDLEVAIEEGATMVRIGTAIFGERNYG